jgi:hypothetical protein
MEGTITQAQMATIREYALLDDATPDEVVRAVLETEKDFP